MTNKITDALIQAFKGLFRNRLITFVSMAIMVSCLLFAGTFAVIGENVNLNLKNITDLNVVKVFVEDADTVDDLGEDAAESDNAAEPDSAVESDNVAEPDNVAETRSARLARIRAEIEALTEKDAISEILFITKDEALSGMGDSLGSEYAHLLDDIDSAANPLPDTFEVHCREGASVASLAIDLRMIEGVRSVKSRDDLAAKIHSLQKGVSYVFIGFTVLCVVVSMFVVMNTIKLAVFARREEIAIMRYIGAGRAYIAAPFVLEGVFIGCISALVALLLEKAIYAFLVDYASVQMGNILTSLYTFGELAPMLSAVFFGIAVFCGIVGSLLSIGKYAEA